MRIVLTRVKSRLQLEELSQRKLKHVKIRQWLPLISVNNGDLFNLDSSYWAY